MLLFNLITLFLFQKLNFSDSLSAAYRQKFVLKVDSLQNSKILENGILALSVKKCKTGQNIVQYNSNKAVRPASTLKLLTTATAFGILGEKFRYQTTLEYQGQIKSDTLFGDILVRGSGDPTLGSWRFDETLDYSRQILHWANDIKNLNVKVITGNILAKADRFSENIVPDTWQWGDMGNYFGAAAFGVNINENMFKAHFKTNRKTDGNTEIIRIEPFLAEIEIKNQVVSDKNTNGDDVLFYSAPYSENIIATGKLPLGREDFVVKGSLPNPPLLATQLLKNALSKLEIQVKNMQKYDLGLNSIIINKVYSPSLLEICTLTNYESINLYAESLLKTIVKSKTNNISTKDGIDAVYDFWKAKGLNMKELYMKDGSGLSYVNAVTANFMTDVLSKSSSEPFYTAFLQSLPILGQDGTMKNIAKNKPWAKNFSVKSGTVEKVKAFAGYFTNKNGELMAFSIMANQFEGRESAMSRELTKLFEDMWYLE